VKPLIIKLEATIMALQDIAPNQVLSVAEGIEIQKRIKAAASAVKQWHWMGNYGDVYGPVNVANGAGVSAGEMIINYNFTTDLVSTWMFY
jgi:hypothetical protein